MLKAYSSVTQAFQGTVNGTIQNFTATYVVRNVSSTTYQVDVDVKYPSPGMMNTTVWFLKNGTVTALLLDGHYFTGASAVSYFQTYFSIWELDLQYGEQIANLTSYFHTSGTSTLKFGPSKITVTNYTAISIPEVIRTCSGESLILTSGGVFSIGAPGGSSYPLVTYLVAAGTGVTISPTGQQYTTTFNFVSKITSVTPA